MIIWIFELLNVFKKIKKPLSLKNDSLMKYRESLNKFFSSLVATNIILGIKKAQYKIQIAGYLPKIFISLAILGALILSVCCFSFIKFKTTQVFLKLIIERTIIKKI